MGSGAPRYGEREVATAPLPTVRTPTSVPIDAVRPLPHIDLSGVVRAANDYYQQEKEKADQIAVMGAVSSASELKTNELQKALSMKGQNALQSREAFDDAWTKGISEISKNLHNDTQRLAFQRDVGARREEAHATLSTHIRTEMDRHDAETVDSLVTNERNAAMVAAVPGADLHSVAEQSTLAIGRQRAATMDFARRQGFSPEQTQEALAQVTSATHAAVIDKLAANEDDITAKRYFEEFHDQLVGKDLVNAEKLVDAGSTRATAQGTTRDIMKSATTLADAMKQVDGITEPRVQDEVRDRVRRAFEDQSASDRLQRAAAFNKASAIVEQTKDDQKIPDAVRVLLSPAENDALRQRSKMLRTPETVTDLSLYSHLINMSALSDATRHSFMDLNLLDPKYRNALSEADYKHILTVQQTLRLSDERKAATQEHSAETATHRKEETTVIKQSEAATKAKHSAELLERTSKGASKFLPPVAKVHVPQWMLDSARTDPDYAEYLRMHGVPVSATSAGSGGPGDSTAQRPRVPGAPLPLRNPQ